MTAVYVDPVVGAAVINLGLTVLPGLPCPTCAGRGGSRPIMFHGVHVDDTEPWCFDCTNGVWTPPDHPVTIGVHGPDGKVIGEGTLRPLKVITDDDIRPAEGSYIIHDGYGRLTLWPEFTDISSALPFLPGLKPGDTVYLLDGFTESVAVPDDGTGEPRNDLPGWDDWDPADGLFRLSCPFPVDAPDHPCVTAA